MGQNELLHGMRFIYLILGRDKTALCKSLSCHVVQTAESRPKLSHKPLWSLCPALCHAANVVAIPESINSLGLAPRMLDLREDSQVNVQSILKEILGQEETAN